MAFKSKEFLAQQFKPREDSVKVPDLADWFDGEPVWTVRGLTGQELGKANTVAEKSREIRAILEGLSSKNSKRVTEAVSQMVDPDTPLDIAKRIAMIQYGSVDPVCSEQLALKLCTTFPVEFYSISTKILELTGKGQTSGESKPFGTIEKSEAA